METKAVVNRFVACPSFRFVDLLPVPLFVVACPSFRALFVLGDIS